MSSPTRKGATQNPREVDQVPRRSTRTMKKQPGSHPRRPQERQTKRPVTSKDVKMPKIVKSPPPSQEQKLDILHSPKKNNPTVIKSHEDSPSVKSNLSSKKSFWGSPDISSAIENLFDAMGLYEKSKSLIISMNLCSIKNMIQLSELAFHEVANLFPRQDLRESVFQDSVIKVLCLGRSFKLLIQEKAGLDEQTDIAKSLIPSTFEEETSFLDEDGMSKLKEHYMAYYRQMRKDFLDCLEDFVMQDSLIGSTTSTRSKNTVSCASKISSPSDVSEDTKVFKSSSKSNGQDFYPKHLNHAFMPKPDFDGSRNDVKKAYENDPYPLGVDEYQVPDHPSSFMNMIEGRSQAISAANDERRQVLPSRVIWDASIDRFEVFRNSVEGHYGQVGAGYLFDTSFQTAYLEKGVDCYVDFMDEVPSASQIKKDAHALYGALLSACQGGVGRRILMENRGKQDGIRSWYQLVNQYETDGNKNVRIKKLENVITTVFHQHYKGGLFKWIQDYEDAFTELVILGQVTWNDDNIKKRRLVQNAQNIGMIDNVFEALVSDKSFLETCNFLRSNAIRYDKQSKEKNARQINNTSQSPGTSKKDKIKTVLALNNQLQVQDSAGSDEEIETSPSSQTALVCKLAQVPPEIWMTLPLEAKKWLLNERKRQQQEEDKSKKSSDTNGNDAFKMSERNKNNSSKLPNQYAKVKNTAKG
jgi:hypothetical protein